MVMKITVRLEIIYHQRFEDPTVMHTIYCSEQIVESLQLILN